MKKKLSLFNIKIRKNLLFFIIIAVFILLVFLFLFYKNWGFINILYYFQRHNSNVVGIILFEGNNCSHCVKVDDFIKDNKIEDKIKFTRLEVFDNVANANILADKSQICGLNPQQVGVPFVWDGKNCIIGDVDVIKFFQNKIHPVK